MRCLGFLLTLFSFSLFLIVSGTPLHQNSKRATEVALIDQAYDNNVLSGSINVQNIAFLKVVTVVWAVGNSWSDSQTITATWSSGPDSSGYELWTFSGSAPGATQFYIRYTVSGTTYYDPGNNINYLVKPPPTPFVASTTIAPTDTNVPTVTLPPVIPASIPTDVPVTPLTGCQNWNGWDNCWGNSFEFFPSSERRRWQTPPRGDAAYFPSFQDYSDLVGYADIQYNPGHTVAVVTVNAASKTGEQLSYNFGGNVQHSSSFRVNSSLTDPLPITVTSANGKQLVLEPLNFIWQNVPLTAAQSSFTGGQKGAIVELFGWPYNDVAKECSFIGKAGYMGVKVWPPNEHVWGSYNYEPDSQFRPWYFVYQPVSYRLHSRHGTREELRAMINACRAAGVRVYADAVINHMTGQGTDIQNHRTSGCSLYSGHNATDNSPYFTSGNTFLINPFTGTRPAMEYPAVPYAATDFHCQRDITDWSNGDSITKGWLVSLADLNTEKPYVQDRIATYLADLLSIGFSGFRVDAAKHIGPQSQAQIFGRLKNKLGGNFPGDFISWLEVIVGGGAETDLEACGGGEWSWYTNFNNKLSAAGLNSDDIDKIKIWSSADYPKNHPICGRWIIPPSRFAIQNDDHDQQSPGSSPRDMGDRGSVLIKEKNVGKHRNFELLLFARTDADWNIKLLLSSYMFMDNGGAGFPDGLSDCSLYTGPQPISGCKGVPKDQAYVANACGYTMSQGKYTRPHRDVKIINAMRGWVGLNRITASKLGIPGCS
ncbi:glycoside hydrolase superfamily [Trichophaea hybrida]|nr:glycoside hydrolase superfamily [Trichophaea hybrida]